MKSRGSSSSSSAIAAPQSMPAVDAALATRCFLDDTVYHVKRMQMPHPWHKPASAGGGGWAGSSVRQRPPAEPPALFDFGAAAAAVRCPVLLIYGEGAVQMVDAMGLDMSARRGTMPALFSRAAAVVERSIAEGSVFVINSCAARWAALVHEHLTSREVVACTSGAGGGSSPGSTTNLGGDDDGSGAASSGSGGDK